VYVSMADREDGFMHPSQRGIDYTPRLFWRRADTWADGVSESNHETRPFTLIEKFARERGSPVERSCIPLRSR
jgi:hypothetical protein